jgi:hypothetical protein
MCPWPKILGCYIPWTKCPLAILPLTEPSHPIPLALQSGGILCVGRACIRRRGANPINLVRGVGEAGQTPHWSIRSLRQTELVPCLTRTRVGTHRSGAQYPRDALFKGRNIQEFSVGDTSVGGTSTLHPDAYAQCTHKFLTRMLRVRISSWCVCSACFEGTALCQALVPW